MIPDFKTFLKESVWSDMQDRGTGDLEKKEDNIDNLTFEEFYDYLNSHYTYIGPGKPRTIEYYEKNTSACILFAVSFDFIAIDYEEFGDKKYTIRPGNDLINSNPDLYAKLKKRYVVKNNKSIVDQTYFSIEPVKGDIDYKFIIEVIDYINSLSNKPLFQKKVNESVWSDMQDRGTGDMNKNEDDIDLMDEMSLYEYIHDLYEVTANVSRPQDVIRWLKTSDGNRFYIIVGCGMCYGKILTMCFRYSYSQNAFACVEMEREIRDLLGDNFKDCMKKYTFRNFNGIDYVITPKDSNHISNKEVIEFIDNILSGLENPIIKKIEK